MVLSVLATVILTGQNQSSFPVGSYKPDISRAPAQTRGPLIPYFGQSLLVVRANGEFYLCGIEQEGFWRKHGDRFVFIYDGFFRVRSSLTKTELMKVWPESHLEGFVLTKGTGNTLELADFGAVKGPIIFRPMPKRSFAQFVEISQREYGSAASEEAYFGMTDIMQRDYSLALDLIADAKRSSESRSWLSIVYNHMSHPEAIDAAARLILDSKLGSTSKLDRRLRSNLSRAVMANPTVASVDLMIEAESKGLIPKTSVARGMGRLGRPSDIPLLMNWLETGAADLKTDCLEALTKIGAAEAMILAHGLANDENESVQIEANSLIARTTKDDGERKAAVAKMAGWTKSDNFMTALGAAEALLRSQAPEALPYVIAILYSDAESLVRRNTAMMLGDHGDLRAVPALMDAQKRKVSSMDEMVGESEVRREAAEALAKLGKKKPAIAKVG